MTDDRMPPIDRIEKGADGDLVRDLRASAAERMMEVEVEARTGAPTGPRSAARLTQRNGQRERAWETRAGRIDLAIPTLRKGRQLASFLEPRRTAEKALTAVIQEACLHGLSTRAVDDLVKEGPHRGGPPPPPVAPKLRPAVVAMLETIVAQDTAKAAREPWASPRRPR